jgi:hypothetical protein
MKSVPKLFLPPIKFWQEPIGNCAARKALAIGTYPPMPRKRASRAAISAAPL